MHFPWLQFLFYSVHNVILNQWLWFNSYLGWGPYKPSFSSHGHESTVLRNSQKKDKLHLRIVTLNKLNVRIQQVVQAAVLVFIFIQHFFNRNRFQQHARLAEKRREVVKINLLTPFCVDQRNSKVSSYRESLVFVAGAKSIDVVFYALYAYRHRFLLICFKYWCRQNTWSLVVYCNMLKQTKKIKNHFHYFSN